MVLEGVGIGGLLFCVVSCDLVECWLVWVLLEWMLVEGMVVVMFFLWCGLLFLVCVLIDFFVVGFVDVV